jgi:histidinol-phosphate aminotransferase
VIDFSVNLNPFGLPPGIKSLGKDIKLFKYPDSQAISLRHVIARQTGLSIENIIVGNGSTELIRLAVTAYIGGLDKALIIEPTYGEYRTACEISGVEIITQTLSAKNDFKPDIAAIVKLIKKAQPKAIFVCNPNNPTGYYLRQNEFQMILDAAPHSLIILDEAYISFIKNSWSSLKYVNKTNLLIIRSLTKNYSLAGLRLGYAIANKEIIEVLSRVCPPWNVNVVAQYAGNVALNSENFLKNSCEQIENGTQYLVKRLEKLGFHCLPSEANFFLVRVGNAAEFKKKLLRKGVLVRDCTSFGLSEYIRIAPQTPTKNRKLISTIKEVLFK